MDNSFKDIRIVDNFYQSSSFFPMPLCLIGTLDEKGTLTSFGSYSLCFPYYIAGKGYYAMVLECRNNSNTCKGILRHGKCTINFLPFSKKNFAEHVRLGFPGDTPEEKICPRCGKILVMREAKRGNYVGEKFYGCSGYPKCRYIEKCPE